MLLTNGTSIHLTNKTGKAQLHLTDLCRILLTTTAHFSQVYMEHSPDRSHIRP